MIFVKETQDKCQGNSTYITRENIRYVKKTQLIYQENPPDVRETHRIYKGQP